jgi:hypothetical protein
MQRWAGKLFLKARKSQIGKLLGSFRYVQIRKFLRCARLQIFMMN